MGEPCGRSDQVSMYFIEVPFLLVGLERSWIVLSPHEVTGRVAFQIEAERLRPG